VLIAISLAGGGLSRHAVNYLPVLLALVMLTLGAAFFLAGAVVFLTDLTYIWGLATRLLFFLTPIFYVPQMIHHPLAQRVIAANPMALLVTLGRQCLLDGRPLGAAEVTAAFVGPVLVLALGWGSFQFLKPRIADYI
jgi:ABC-type polysaccharide/polyol phosphate export permease